MSSVCDHNNVNFSLLALNWKEEKFSLLPLLLLFALCKNLNKISAFTFITYILFHK